jgi:hypothetical protein
VVKVLELALARVPEPVLEWVVKVLELALVLVLVRVAEPVLEWVVKVLELALVLVLVRVAEPVLEWVVTLLLLLLVHPKCCSIEDSIAEAQYRDYVKAERMDCCQID